MEYFNTFGGNPVAMAAGLGVLGVLDSEDLRANARTVGAHILHRFNTLVSEFPTVVYEARGKGLFLGLEFAYRNDSEDDDDDYDDSPVPASALAQRVKDFCFSKRVLVSLDGKWSNVLKVKPPMVFTLGNADHLCNTVREALVEIMRDREELHALTAIDQVRIS